jgi:L-amino acid N-acyltransferase YncA
LGRSIDIHIRLATEEDLTSVTEIYNQAISLQSATADLAPVSLENRRAWLSEHNAKKYPVFVAETDGAVVGYCSLSAYRPGRMALRHTAEISYYVHEDFRGRGIASVLIGHAIDECPQLETKTLFAILLDINSDSVRILEKFGFEKWGHMPRVADFGGVECGHLYYGLRLSDR